MKKTKYSQILDTLTDDRIPQDLDLAPAILNRIQKNKGANMKRRLKVLVPTLIVVMLAVVTLTVPAVAQAIQRWFGYVPGFGLVADSNIRSLAEPIQVTQGGFTLRVTDVTASSSKIVIKYNLGEINKDMLLEGHSCQAPDQLPVLKLSDGSKPDLQMIGWEYDAQKIFIEVQYAGIPQDVDDMTLLINCISQTKAGAIPWEWNVPLSLGSTTQSTVSIAPVYEVPVSTGQPTDVGSADGTLQVNQIIPLENGFIFSGSMSVDPVSGLTVDEFDGYLEDLSILDANGKILEPSIVPGDFIIEGDGIPSNQFNWAFQITESDFAWPLIITVNSVRAITAPFAPSGFTLEVGQDPQADQMWKLEKDVPLGPKFAHVVSIKRLIDTYGQNGYELSIINDPSFDLNFEIENCDPNGGGGSGGMETGDIMTLARSCRIVPTGTINVILSGYGVEQIQGPWQVTVNEPVKP